MTFENELDQVVAKFVTQISDIARRAARATLDAVFAQGGAAPSAPSARANGANGTNGARAGKAPAAAVRAPGRPAGGRGVKRAPEDLDALADQFVTFVKANPGMRIEQINKELGTTTKDLALPIRKLVADGVVSVKGQRRATQYFPGKKAK